MGNSLAKCASSLGQGLLAGFVGTMAISAFQMMRHGPKIDTTPADAAGKVIGIEPQGLKEKKVIAKAVHWSYGTLWGSMRGFLASLGIRGIPATLIHFGTIYTTALAMLPALNEAPPVNQRDKKEVSEDAFAHLIYAFAAGIVFDAIHSSSSRRKKKIKTLGKEISIPTQR